MSIWVIVVSFVFSKMKSLISLLVIVLKRNGIMPQEIIADAINTKTIKPYFVSVVSMRIMPIAESSPKVIHK